MGSKHLEAISPEAKHVLIGGNTILYVYNALLWIRGNSWLLFWLDYVLWSLKGNTSTKRARRLKKREKQKRKSLALAVTAMKSCDRILKEYSSLWSQKGRPALKNGSRRVQACQIPSKIFLMSRGMRKSSFHKTNKVICKNLIDWQVDIHANAYTTEQ